MYFVASGDTTSRLYFNDDNKKAVGTLKCQGQEVIDISSVNYGYRTTKCNSLCPTAFSVLDGTNTICKNENVIRALCSARNTCEVTAVENVMQPFVNCNGQNRTAAFMEVTFGCVNPGKSLNLLELHESCEQNFY